MLWLPRWCSAKDSSGKFRRCKRHGFAPWVRKTLRHRKRQPTPVFLPGKLHGQRSLVCYRPWGHKESDLTWLSPHTYIHRHSYVVVFPFFGLCCVACGILVPQPGIEPMYPALDEWGLNHWTTREVPTCFSFLFSLGINFLSFGYFWDLISFSDYHVFLKGKILDRMLGGKESRIKRTHSLSFWSWKIIENFRARETLREASVQFSSVAQSCPTLCDPMNRSTPGLPVHHQLPEFT